VGKQNLDRARLKIFFLEDKRIRIHTTFNFIELPIVNIARACGVFRCEAD